jgi:hypothetical protein
MPESLRPLFERAVDHAVRYRESVADGPAHPAATYHDLRDKLMGPVPETGTPAEAMLEELAAFSEQGLMPIVGPRFFGWVMGASHPAGVAAD